MENNNKNSKNDYGYLLILLIGIFSIVIAPYLFTRTVGSISFLNSGQIGDTIGGITAPITGILGAILVYLALKAQIKANQLIFEQFQDQKKEENYKKFRLYVSDQIESLRQEINEMLYNSTRTIGKEKEKIDLKGVLVKLSSFYKITIDLLLKLNLSKTTPEQLIRLNDRILFPIHVKDTDGDAIELIPDSAKAGYAVGYGDPEYIEQLETMKLPFLQNGKYRAFPIEGDSMAPKVKNGSYVIGKYVENLKSIKDGKTYVILLQNDGILYKRLYWRDSKLEFVSDNKFYDPYIVFPSEIIEVWEFSCAIDMTDDEETDVSNQQLLETLLAMKNKR